MEENVVTTVVETPVTPEVAAETKAIEPVQVPVIEVPAVKEEKFLGVDKKTAQDLGISFGLMATGAVLDRAIPWAIKKVKDAIKTAKTTIEIAKNGTKLDEQVKAEAATEAPAAAEATPVTPQENK